jgi:thiamine pyrophosphate-dependent acetolactate synthase large subunit-like protein
MVTAAALAHVNRLPVLLLPGDVFAGRRPDPVLQQVEDFADGTVSANDCFRPVSRYWDRITRPEQLLASLPAALRVLTDPVECGPATLAFPQECIESYDWPKDFPHRVRPARAGPMHGTRGCRPEESETACRRRRRCQILLAEEALANSHGARHTRGRNPGRQGQPAWNTHESGSWA